MAMIRSEMRDEVRVNIKRDGTGGTNAFSDDKINRRLDWAQYSICDTYTFEEMRKVFTALTVADQKRYAFPTGMKDIYDMTLQDGTESRKLIYVPARSTDKVIPRPEELTGARPIEYIDYGINFELIPIPDDEYTLQMRCSVYVADFSGDSVESELLRKDRLIIARATGLCYHVLKEIDMAKYWNEEVYKEALAEAIETDHSAEDWTPIARGYDTRAPEIPPGYLENPLIGLR